MTESELYIDATYEGGGICRVRRDNEQYILFVRACNRPDWLREGQRVRLHARVTREVGINTTEYIPEPVSDGGD